MLLLAKAPSGYTGPGDTAGLTWNSWGSCAFTFSLAKASTSTNLCDLNAVTGGAAVCTLRGSSSGSVDLTGYCPGSVTPSAACAAASGGSCVISKVYDQTGTGSDWTQATAANMPPIVFSGGIGTQPTIVLLTGAATFLTSGNVNLNSPFTVEIVAEKLGPAPTVEAYLWQHFSSINFIAATSGAANSIDCNGFTVTASDGAAHAIQCGFVTGSSFLNVDGSNTTGAGSFLGGNQPSLIGQNGTTGGGNRYIGEIGTNNGSTFNSALRANVLTRWGI
jgi:hypothetical protein